jgi:hypothetical protein
MLIAQVPHRYWTTISLIFGGAPQSCNCIVNASCTFNLKKKNRQMICDEGVLPRRSTVALENAMTVKSKETLEKRVAVFDIGSQFAVGCSQRPTSHGRQG